MGLGGHVHCMEHVCETASQTLAAAFTEFRASTGILFGVCKFKTSELGFPQFSPLLTCVLNGQADRHLEREGLQSPLLQSGPSSWQVAPHEELAILIHCFVVQREVMSVYCSCRSLGCQFSASPCFGTFCARKKLGPVKFFPYIQPEQVRSFRITGAHTHSLTYLLLTHSPTHSLTRSLTHPETHSITH